MGKMFFEKINQDLEKVDPSKELPPIPRESVDGWKKIPVRECEEKLVPVGAFSEFSHCDTSAVYFGERGKNREMNFLGRPVNRDVSLITHFVREGILKKLKIAQSLMPESYYFHFFDNYRPLPVQDQLFKEHKEDLKREHPEWSENVLDEKTQIGVGFASPSKERGTTHPSSHSTGGVVDLTIIKMNDEGMRLLKELEIKKGEGKLDYSIAEDEKGELQAVINWINEEANKRVWSKEYKIFVLNNWLSEYRYAREKARLFKNYTSALNMGTKFDYFGPEMFTMYYEDLANQRELTDEEKDILQNRRFLYQVMKKSDFSNYPEEWWHWSCGDNMDAANCKKDHAIYGGIEMSEENLAFEKARRGPYFDAIGKVGRKALFTDFIEEDPTEIAA